MSDSDIIETFVVQEIFTDGLADIHIVGSNFKCTYYSLQVVPGHHDPQKVAALRLTIPISGLRDCLEKAGAAINSQVVQIAEIPKRMLS